MMLVALLFVALQGALCQDILLLQEVFRHGARYALGPQYQPDLPETIYGELTSVGKRMHYLLGKQLYAEYWERLNMPPFYNASLIRVNSTDFNRTIESCQSQLFGWLEAVDKEEFQGQPLFDGINFQPVPINVYQKNILYPNGEGEPMLYYDYPNNDKWKEENYNSEFYTKKVKPIVDQELQVLKSKFDLDFKDLHSLVSFIDGYHSNKSLGFEIHPIFRDPNHKGKLEFIYIVSQYLDIFYSPGQITVSTSQFFAELKQNILATVFNRSTVRLRLYSAHDVTIMNLLTGLGLSNAELVYQKYIVQNTTQKGPWSYPPYASNLLFELSQSLQPIPYYYNGYKINASYSIKIRYNGDYYNLTFCKSPATCSIADFLAYLDRSIDPNYLILGGYGKSRADRSQSLIIMSSLLAAYIVFKGFYFLRRANKQQKTKQPHLPKSSEINSNPLPNPNPNSNTTVDRESDKQPPTIQLKEL